MSKNILGLALLLCLISSSSLANLNISTYNIRNYSPEFRMSDFNEKTSKPHLKKVLKELNSDIIAVQEIVDSKDFGVFILNHLPEFGITLSSCGGTAKQKLGFLYNKNKVKLIKTSEDLSLSKTGKCNKGLRPAFIGEFKNRKTNKVFTIISLHLKAGNGKYSESTRVDQYRAISNIINNFTNEQKESLVILGDLNTTGFISKKGTYLEYNNFLKKNSLIDISANIKCSAYWWGQVNDKKEYPSQLDHIIITKKLFKNNDYHDTKSMAHCQATKCKVATEEQLGMSYKRVSDHCPVTTNI